MRSWSWAVVTLLALVSVACGDDDDSSPSGGAGSSVGGAADTGGSPSRGGSVSSTDVEFTDLPGKIRFINYVSDGTTGVDLDLYWGISIGRGEKFGTIAYGEITEFMTPRRADEALLKADEARFFLVPKGDMSSNPASFLVQDDPTFAEDTVLTIAMAAGDTRIGTTPNVSEQVFYEAKLSTPPAGMAHVYGWSSAFEKIDDGDFVVVGADDLCGPDDGDPGDSNLGNAALIPAGSTGLALFDANTEPPCATGTPPVTGSIEAGHSYVLLGRADTHELDARRAVLLEVGSEN
jgi:hypothetical protein